MDIGKYMQSPKKKARAPLAAADGDDDDDASVSSSRSLSSLWRRSRSKSRNDLSSNASANSSRSFSFRRRRSFGSSTDGTDTSGESSSLFFRKKRPDKSPTRDKKMKKTRKTKGSEQVDSKNDDPVEDDSKDLKSADRSIRERDQVGSAELKLEKKTKKKARGDGEHTIKSPKGKKKKKTKLGDQSGTTDSEHLIKSPKGKKKKKKGSPNKSSKKANHAIDPDEADQSGHPDADEVHEGAPKVEDEAINTGEEIEKDVEGEEGSVALNDTNKQPESNDGSLLADDEAQTAEPTVDTTVSSNSVPHRDTDGEKGVQDDEGEDNEEDKVEEAQDTVSPDRPGIPRRQSRLGSLFRRNSKSQESPGSHKSSPGSSKMSPGTLKTSILKIRTSMSAKGRGSGFGSFFSGGTADDADGDGAKAGGNGKKRFSDLWRPLGVPDLDGDDGNDESSEAQMRLIELKSDNEQLRAQLDWSLQQLEKLNEKELHEKKNIDKLEEKYEKLQKEHKEHLDLVDNLKHFVENQESKLMEKDMQIMTLEESVHGGGDDQSYQEGFTSLKSGLSRKASLPRNIDVLDKADSDELGSAEVDELRSAKSEIIGRSPRARRSRSPMRPSRDRSKSPMRVESEGAHEWRRGASLSPKRTGSMDWRDLRNKHSDGRRVEELEDQIVSKDKAIEELKKDLESMKEKLDQQDSKDLVKENKSLRNEVSRLKRRTMRKSSKHSSRNIGTAGTAADDNSEPNEVDMTELHRQLTEEGISPTLDLEKDAEEFHDSRVSILSCGDQSYIEDLENQAETLDERRHEALMEEAQERYEKELEEKGLPENEELFSDIFDALLEEEEDSIQKEHEFFADKLEEMRKRQRFSRIKDHEVDKGNSEAAGTRQLRDEIKALKAELDKANQKSDTLTQDLEASIEKLAKRAVEIANLEQQLEKSQASSNGFFRKDFRAELNQQKHVNKMLSEELHEARVKLDQKEEKVAALKYELDQLSGEDWAKRLKYLEKEVEKLKFENKELKVDLSVAEAELDEIRDTSSQRSYFSTSRTKFSRETSADLSSKGSASGGTSRSGGRFGLGLGGSNNSDRDGDDASDNGSKLNGYMKSYFGSKPTPSKSDLFADEKGENENSVEAAKSNVMDQTRGYFGSSTRNIDTAASDDDPSHAESTPEKQEEAEEQGKESPSMQNPFSRYFGGGKSEPQTEMQDNSAHGSTSSGLFASLYGSKQNLEASKTAIELS